MMPEEQKLNKTERYLRQCALHRLVWGTKRAHVPAKYVLLFERDLIERSCTGKLSFREDDNRLHQIAWIVVREQETGWWTRAFNNKWAFDFVWFFVERIRDG